MTFQNPNESVSKQIIEGRLAALTALGAPVCDRCPTCMGAAAQPYRRENASGDIVEGCVDAHHTEHFEAVRRQYGEWPSVAWHFRLSAVGVRRSWLERLQGE